MNLVYFEIPTQGTWPVEVRGTHKGETTALRRGRCNRPHTCVECRAPIRSGQQTWRMDYRGKLRGLRWCDRCVGAKLIEAMCHRMRVVGQRAKEERAKQAALLEEKDNTIARLHLALGAITEKAK